MCKEDTHMYRYHTSLFPAVQYVKLPLSVQVINVLLIFKIYFMKIYKIKCIEIVWLSTYSSCFPSPTKSPSSLLQSNSVTSNDLFGQLKQCTAPLRHTQYKRKRSFNWCSQHITHTSFVLSICERAKEPGK